MLAQSQVQVRILPEQMLATGFSCCSVRGRCGREKAAIHLQGLGRNVMDLWSGSHSVQSDTLRKFALGLMDNAAPDMDVARLPNTVCQDGKGRSL